MRLRLIILMFVSSILLLSSCKKEEDQLDEFQQFGVIGTWKFEKQFVDGVDNLSIECCDYLDFTFDEQMDYLRGNVRAYGTGYDDQGSYQLSHTDSTIFIDVSNNPRTYNYQKSDSILTFTYTEAGQSIIEDCVVSSLLRDI